MARNSGDNRGGGASRDFEDMSNADLIAFIGGDVDPTTSRADLIVMAVQADDTRRGQT
jgi:hypothetical protein